jgi:hypothetical protein
MEENISFADLKRFVADHVEAALGITEFDITYAELFEEETLWRVNIEYRAKPEETFSTVIALSVDSKTGEVLGLWKDRHWD